MQGADSTRFLLDERPALLATALLLAGDRSAAEDLADDALERTLRRFDRRTDPRRDALRALVAGATGRPARLRGEQVLTALDDPFTADAPLARALRDLPPRTRAATVLAVAEELPPEVVADLLGTDVTAARDELARGTTALTTALPPPPGVRVERHLHAALTDLATAPGRWRRTGEEAAEEIARAARRRTVLRAGLAVAAAALVVAAVPVVRALPDRPAPAAPGGPAAVAGAAPETVSRALPVLVGPTRGSLAGDAALVAAVRTAGWGPVDAPPPTDREVVLLTDTPDGRVALVVGTVDEDFRGVWLTGPPGAPADRLSPSVPTHLGRDRPASLLLGGPGRGTLVTVAAPGDTVEVSSRLRGGPLGTLSRDYEDAGAVDGVAVVPATSTAYGPATSVRVTREGRLVYRSGVDWVPAGTPQRSYRLPSLTPLRPSPAAPDADLVRTAVLDTAVPFDVDPAELQPDVLWVDSPAPGLRVAVVVLHGPGGGLVVTTWAVGPDGAPVACGTQTPPGSAPLAGLTVARVCDLGEGTPWLVLSAPTTAVTADVLDDAGGVLTTVRLQGGGAVLRVPDGAVAVEARDAAGRPVRDAPVAPSPVQPFGDFGPGPLG